jgi:hypothetical protein
MTVLKRLSFKFLFLAAMLISLAASVEPTKAAMLSCSACAAAVENDLGLCYKLQAQANACGINWIQDPCPIDPSQVCISGCTCN